MLRSPLLFGSIILASVWYVTFDFSDSELPLDKSTNSQPEVLTLQTAHPAIVSKDSWQYDQCVKVCLLDTVDAFSV